MVEWNKTNQQCPRLESRNYTFKVERIPNQERIVKYDVHDKNLLGTTIKVWGSPKYATAHGKANSSNDLSKNSIRGWIVYFRVLPLSHCRQLASLLTVAMSNLYPVASTYNNRIKRWKKQLYFFYLVVCNKMNKWFRTKFGRST